MGFCLCCRHFAWLVLALTDRIGDICQNALKITQDIFIPESDYFESVLFESSGPRGVLLFLFFLRMLAAIHFHDQSMPQAAEIDDVIADGMLTAELRAVEAFRAEILPKETFGGGLFAPQTAAIGT